MARSLLALLLAVSCQAKDVVLSNIQLPFDTSGDLLLTGELSVIQYNGAFFVYMNNWGGCPGVDCCPTSGGCSACCFTQPPFTDPCVYTGNHSVLVYKTADFVSWEYEGIVLSTANRKNGTEFRPQVVYNGTHFILWYEDRWSGQNGYAVAVSTTPTGPFSTLHNTVIMSGPGRIGDYDVFVDDDGTAYHVRTGIVIEELTPNMCDVTGRYYSFSDSGVEGPSMFKRNGIYYLTMGEGCCACRGGSNVVVYTSSHALGPYTRQADVGSNTTDGHVWNPHSPWNYVTRAQGSKIIPVAAADGSLQYLWIGNQWVTSTQPGNPRDHDLLFWAVLEFNASGAVAEMKWTDSTTLSVQ